MIKPRRLAETLIYMVTEKGISAEEAGDTMCTFLKRVNQESYIPLVNRVLQKFAEAHTRDHALYLRSAYGLDKELEQDIAELLQAERVGTTVEHDAIGGFEARYKGREIGMSFDKEIERLHKHLVS